MTNLPHPVIREEIDGHAYVSVKDCVVDILGQGLEVDVIPLDQDLMLLSSYSLRSVKYKGQQK